MTVRVMAFCPRKFKEGFEYPPDFVEAVKAEFPPTGKPMNNLLYECIATNDILLGRFLDDSGSALYDQWRLIFNAAEKEDNGSEDGFVARDLS